MRPLLIRAAWLVALVVMKPVSARADAAGLVGLTSVDDVRPSYAFSFGYRPAAVGFEIEYLSTIAGDYSGGGIFASLIVQPVMISNVQIFAVGGVGVWGEGFEGGKRTGVLSAVNVGGGVLVPLAGPLSLRLDYRLFVLGEVSKEEVGAIAPGTRHPQRIAAGIHFDF